MKRLYGNKSGLKSNQIRRLEKIYRRRIPPEFLITSELAHEICYISHEIRRQIGLLINRTGQVAYVIVGDQQKIFIPDTSEYRVAPGRLRGLRCIHTHLKNESLTQDDLTGGEVRGRQVLLDRAELLGRRLRFGGVGEGGSELLHRPLVIPVAEGEEARRLVLLPGRSLHGLDREADKAGSPE